MSVYVHAENQKEQRTAKQIEKELTEALPFLLAEPLSLQKP